MCPYQFIANEGKLFLILNVVGIERFVIKDQPMKIVKTSNIDNVKLWILNLLNKGILTKQILEEIMQAHGEQVIKDKQNPLPQDSFEADFRSTE